MVIVKLLNYHRCMLTNCESQWSQQTNVYESIVQHESAYTDLGPKRWKLWDLRWGFAEDLAHKLMAARFGDDRRNMKVFYWRTTKRQNTMLLKIYWNSLEVSIFSAYFCFHSSNWSFNGILRGASLMVLLSAPLWVRSSKMLVLTGTFDQQLSRVSAGILS